MILRLLFDLARLQLRVRFPWTEFCVKADWFNGLFLRAHLTFKFGVLLFILDFPCVIFRKFKVIPEKQDKIPALVDVTTCAAVGHLPVGYLFPAPPLPAMNQHEIDNPLINAAHQIDNSRFTLSKLLLLLNLLRKGCELVR